MADPGRRSLRSKLRESFRALQLERRFGKDRILEMYLNLTPYGGNVEGIGAAAWFYFGKGPDQWRRVVSREVECQLAVEEMIRFDPPLQLFERWVLAEDFAVGDVSIPLGSKIAMLFGSANRDPRAFEQPDEFDVGRANAAQHIGFGGGIHVCIGAPLARIELEASVAALRRYWPDFELVEEPRRTGAFVIWGLKALRLARR